MRHPIAKSRARVHRYRDRDRYRYLQLEPRSRSRETAVDFGEFKARSPRATRLCPSILYALAFTQNDHPPRHPPADQRQVRGELQGPHFVDTLKLGLEAQTGPSANHPRAAHRCRFLRVLAEMGHGDEIVCVRFPPRWTWGRIVRARLESRARLRARNL